MHLCLERDSLSNHQITVGRLYGPSGFICVTIEPPWRDNSRSVSCIPVGFYSLVRVVSPRFGVTFSILNVPSRSGILFHKGNSVADTRGCILPVSDVLWPPEGPYGRWSGRAFNRFLKALTGVDKATIDIVSDH